jgi:hypothetical protein
LGEDTKRELGAKAKNSPETPAANHEGNLAVVSRKSAPTGQGAIQDAEPEVDRALPVLRDTKQLPDAI